MKKCGIIGGLGPSATVDLYRLIIKHTQAKRDQEHIRTIIDSHPQIPDRTAALLSGGQSPIDALVESINLLKDAQADVIVCPCNTAHIFLRQLQESIQFNFIDMIEETISQLAKENIREVGLLSTAGTAQSEIYQKTGDRFGVKVLIPSKMGIAKEMEAIYGEKGIKAGPEYEKSQLNKALLIEVMEEFKNQGVQTVILGCTELPLCLDASDTPMQLVNPTEILAKAVVRYCQAS